jgi:ribose transport system permease protein
MSEQTGEQVQEQERLAEDAVEQSRPRRGPSLGRITEVRNLGLLGVLLALGILGTVTQSTFLTRSNLLNILTQGSDIGVVTVGMTFVIIGGGIDLSVGALVALSSVWATTLATQSHGSAAMVFCAVIVGMGAGLVNGLLVAYGRLVPFIVTLAMLTAARGLAQRISNEQSQLVTRKGILNLADSKPLGVPVVVWMFAVVSIIGWYILNRTTYGRRTFAVGGNSEAARLAGINVKIHVASLYVVSGLCCGIAALMLASETTTGSSTHGDLYELNAIAAVIIGGTLLTGGRGTLIGSVLGVLVFMTISDLFVLNNLQTEVQNIAKGAIIVVAVLLQRRGRAEGRT